MSRASARKWLREVEARADAFADDLALLIADALTKALMGALSTIPIDSGRGPVLAAGSFDDGEFNMDLRPLIAQYQKHGFDGASALIAAADEVAEEGGVSRQMVLDMYNQVLEYEAKQLAAETGEPVGQVGTPMPADVQPKLDAETFSQMLDGAESQILNVFQAEAGALGGSWDVSVPGNIQAASRVTTMLGDIEAQARSVLSSSVHQALTEGWSVERTARRMVDSGAFEKAAARNYARTAVNASQNAAHFAMFNLAAREGDMLEWVAANNPKTRPTHRSASGQRVPVGGLFTVGGYPAKHPGDMSLPMSELANCRCNAVMIAVEDLDDDPIHDPEDWADRNPQPVMPDPEVEKPPPASTVAPPAQRRPINPTEEGAAAVRATSEGVRVKERFVDRSYQIRGYSKDEPVTTVTGGKVLGIYKRNGDRPINNHLRFGADIDNTHLDALSAMDDLMRVSTVPADVRVFRGSAVDHVDPRTVFKPGEVFTDDAFMSTSLDRRVSQHFLESDEIDELELTPIMFEIDVPRGARGIYFDSDEDELLLDRGTQLRIKSVQNEGFSWRVQAEVIGNE